jgi:hypothetical protein
MIAREPETKRDWANALKNAIEVENGGSTDGRYI